MNDLTFGATLVACLVATVVTVSMEVNSVAKRTSIASAVVHTDDTRKPVATNPDKGCVTAAAAEKTTSVE